MNRLPKVLAPLLFFLIGISLWQVLSTMGKLPPYLLSSPESIFHCFVEDRRELFTAMFYTGFGSLLGFFLSLILGMGMAMALYLSPFLFSVFYPFTVIFQTIPIIAIAPLLVIWFGYGLPTVISATFLASVFPVLMATLSGLRSTDPFLLDLFKLYKASRLTTLRKLVLPFAVAHLMVGLRVAAGLAVIGSIVGEFIGGGGLGSVVDSARTQQRVDKVFAAVILACALGALAIAAINGIGNLSKKKWHFEVF
jgi:NitT/TauT family transport system permease protein